MGNDAIPFFEDGDELTCTPTVAVLGKTFVKISGDAQADGTLSIAPCGAGDKALGIAMWDAAIGQRVTVKTINSGNVMPVTVGAANVAAGVSVLSDADGNAVVPAGAGEHHCLGTVLSGAVAGADAMVSLAYHDVTV